jgi:hypothetical protein
MNVKVDGKICESWHHLEIHGLLNKIHMLGNNSMVRYETYF